jgi:DNA-binding transcriptional ArsR family regulator
MERAMNAPTESTTLDLVFGALADPTRRAILERLAVGEASVTELVEPTALSQPTISKHLKVLERAGLISRGRDAQFRPCRLNAAPLEGAAHWLGEYRKFWEQRLDQLEVYVRELQANEEARKRQEEKPDDQHDPKKG